MAIQDAVQSFNRAIQALPLADRTLLSGLVHRMSRLADAELGLEDGSELPLLASPEETESRMGPETESRMGPETDDRAAPTDKPPAEKKPDMGWETEY